MTNQKLWKQRIERFFKVHGSAAASIVCAKLDESELLRAIEIIEAEGISPGNLRAYQKVMDAIVAHRRPQPSVVQSMLEVPAQPDATPMPENTRDEMGLFPPAGTVRQLDPKVPGVPWLEDNQLKIRLADPKALVDRFNLEQREMGGDAAKGSHLMTLKLGRPRILTRSTPAQLDALKNIKKDFPHFKAVTDRIYSALHARMLAGSAACFKPILLVGGAGLGKTAYLNRVAKTLALEFHELASTANDQISLVGLRPPWKGAGPGTLASIFKLGDTEEGTGNKLIFMDELDKAGTMASASDGASSAGIFEQLLTVLEAGTSSFTDSYLGQDLRLHLRFCSWVFAANDISVQVPEYFLSRVEVFHIERPSPEDYRAGLLDSLYRGVLESVPYAPFFTNQLSQEVIDLLSEIGLTPREIRRLLESSLERCMARFAVPPEMYSVWVTPDDLALKPKEGRRKSIGFVSSEAYPR